VDIAYYQLDAFCDRPFAGNPAAVCPLAAWPEDKVLQAMALEHNLSETAFLVGGGGLYHLRWFTPAIEIDLCGHATLAAAWVVFNRLEPGCTRVTFETRSGPLTVAAEDGLLAMDFPARPPEPCLEIPPDLAAGLGAAPVEAWLSRDYLAVYPSAEDVVRLNPDQDILSRLDCLGIIATAPGTDGVDFVSRFFAPRAGIAEDPVTGSSHCTLVPYWARRLGKAELASRQVSARGGDLFCRDLGGRVRLAGRVVLYLEGRVHLPGGPD